MSKKERFTSPIKCPKCNHTGIAEWEENENPVHGDGLNTLLLSVSDGFLKQINNEITCQKCDVTI